MSGYVVPTIGTPEPPEPPEPAARPRPASSTARFFAATLSTPVAHEMAIWGALQASRSLLPFETVMSPVSLRCSEMNCSAAAAWVVYAMREKDSVVTQMRALGQFWAAVTAFTRSLPCRHRRVG